MESSTQLAKFDQFQTLEEMTAFAEKMIESRLLPAKLKDPSQVIAIVVQGQELGFRAATALNNLHVIEGRVSLSVHAIAALIRKANVHYRLKEDFVWVREDGQTDAIRIQETVTAEDGTQAKRYKYNYVDARTTIEFTEILPDGTRVVQDFSFSLSEARSQELTSKPNWVKMLKIMMRTRCLALGARFVAPHAILGLYETTELADVLGKQVEITGETGYAEVIG